MGPTPRLLCCFVLILTPRSWGCSVRMLLERNGREVVEATRDEEALE
jgi:hypothetical protein